MQISFESLDSLSLHRAALEAAQAEKSATLHLLEILHWVEKRRVYGDRGYSSLFHYVHRGLGYSESQTSERIRAMPLAFAVPEVHESLASGKLTLTSAAKMASHVKQEDLKPEQIVELLPQIENRSVQQVERVLAGLAPESPKTLEKLRPLDGERTELRLTLDEETLRLLEEARALDVNSGVSILEIFKRSLRKYVTDKRTRKTGELKPGKTGELKLRKTRELKSPKLRSTAVGARAGSRTIPRSLKREVWTRDRGKCQYVDTRTGKRCDSAHALEIDHVVPHAKGGLAKLENLRLLCRGHNQLRAIRSFGLKKTHRYLGRGAG